ncbi:hypothetical protein C8Q80DRAFT_1115816 [Daedaleopsis nitida]|nr:hypothetical protein C8Q80DRAFT_1115816 [Daedaleopsis nitida]
MMWLHRICKHPLAALCAVAILFAVSGALAGPINRTIDDQFGDSVTGVLPQYLGAWNRVPCSVCRAKPDPSKVYRGTWHDTTSHYTENNPSSVSLQFTGTAVYVYNIMANIVPKATTFTGLRFTLDGAAVGSFTHIPTETTEYQYNVLVYMNNSLKNMEHTLQMWTEAGPEQDASLSLFDYAVYTSLDSNSSDNSSLISGSQTTAITIVETSSPSVPGENGPQQVSMQTLTGPQTTTSCVTVGCRVSQHSTSSVNPTSSPTPSVPVSSSPVGAVAGATAGAIAALILVALGAFLLWQRSRRMPNTPTPLRPSSASHMSIVSRSFTSECSTKAYPQDYTRGVPEHRIRFFTFTPYSNISTASAVLGSTKDA